MTNYEIIIGYKAVISVNVEAINEEDAKKIALEKFRKQKDKFNKNGVTIQDDNFNTHGITDYDKTWGMLDE